MGKILQGITNPYPVHICDIIGTNKCININTIFSRYDPEIFSFWNPCESLFCSSRDSFFTAEVLGGGNTLDLYFYLIPLCLNQLPHLPHYLKQWKQLPL